MHYLRNLGRRKVRTTLTILGITIGIWALVVFGSMANKITALVEGGSSYYADKVIVSDGSGGSGGFSAVPMSLAVADQLKAVPGIDLVVPTVMMLMDEQPSGVSMGVPPMIGAQPANADQGRETFEMNYAAGGPSRPLTKASTSRCSARISPRSTTRRSATPWSCAASPSTWSGSWSRP